MSFLTTRIAHCCLVAVLMPLGSAVAEAQTNISQQPYRLSTVVVTAEAERAPVVGSSVTVVSGELLTERGVVSPRELTAITPNLAVFDANGDRTPRFSLRGLRENNFSYGESAVGIYVDDVPYSDLYTRGVPLFDVYSGEFYRGPQPTLFGANRPGGVLNLLTHLPGNDWRFRGSASYGNYNALGLEAGFSGPIVEDKLFFGLSGLFSQRDGFAENLINGNDPDDHETLAGRAQLRWTPTERLDITVSVVADRFRDGGVIVRPIATPGDLFDVEYDQDGHNHQSSQTYALRGAWTGDELKVVSVTSWRNWRQDLAGEFDFFEFLTPGISAIPAVQGFADPEVQQWSQEFRIQSVDEDAAFRWNGGAYWSQPTTDYSSGRVYGPFAPIFISPTITPGDTEVTSGRNRVNDYAVFGQVTYTVAEKLDLTAGLRFEYVEIRGDRSHTYNGFPIAAPRNYASDYRSVQPRAGLAYHFTPEVAAWFNFTTGFQPGGFNPSSDTAALSKYDPAESLHYEIGATAKLLDGKLITSASGFWIDTDDYHAYRFVGPGPTDFSILNAQKARTIGGELELRALPCEFFEFRLAAGYQHAEFREFTEPPPSGQNLDGKTINFVPEFTIDASVTARVKAGFYATVGVTAVGDYWFDEGNTAKQNAFALLYANVGWQGKNVGVSFFGRNLTDERYFANALDLGSGFFVGTPGDPLTFGGAVTVKF